MCNWIEGHALRGDPWQAASPGGEWRVAGVTSLDTAELK